MRIKAEGMKKRITTSFILSVVFYFDSKYAIFTATSSLIFLVRSKYIAKQLNRFYQKFVSSFQKKVESISHSSPRFML